MKRNTGLSFFICSAFCHVLAQRTGRPPVPERKGLLSKKGIIAAYDSVILDKSCEVKYAVAVDFNNEYYMFTDLLNYISLVLQINK